jgi:hypothetical protein
VIAKFVRAMSPPVVKTSKQGVAFVKRHGVVLMGGRGPVPTLAEAIAGGPIRGSWWAHEKSHQIFEIVNGVVDSGDVLSCKLVDGKVTYVHRRLWAAFVKLAARFPKAALAKTWNEHTEKGAHRSRMIPFPEWVPREELARAEELSVEEAERMLEPWLALGKKRR